MFYPHLDGITLKKVQHVWIRTSLCYLHKYGDIQLWQIWKGLLGIHAGTGGSLDNLMG